MFRKIIFICIALGALFACSTTFEPTTLSTSTGRFPTSGRIDSEGIKAQKPFDPDYANLLYVKTDAKDGKYNDFFMKSFAQVKPYKRVVGKAELEALVIQKGLAEKVPSVSDLVGLNRLAKEIGPILVVEPTIAYEGGYNFSAQFKAIDARTGSVVLDIRREATNWAGLDEPLFFPLFNAFADWSAGGPILVEDKPEPEEKITRRKDDDL